MKTCRQRITFLDKVMITKCITIEMASSYYRAITFLGLFSLLHAAYSAAQHRSYLRITGQEFTSLPSDIIIQGIISLFLTMYGVIHIAGEFKEIRATVELESKTWETQKNLPSFYIFNHRGKALSPTYMPEYRSHATLS